LSGAPRAEPWRKLFPMPKARSGANRQSMTSAKGASEALRPASSGSGLCCRTPPEEDPMSIDTLATWHELVTSRNTKGLTGLLADDVVFHSPVVHTPQVGKAITAQYLGAAFHVFFNPSFRYVREIVGPRDAVLEFQVDIDGIAVNGVDMLKWNDEGLVVEFKVLVRPLKAINLIHQKMGAMLQARQQPAPT
jgi:hypothetical protein